MPENKKTVIRCRGVILHDGKLLVVKHPDDISYAALPGGHLEWGEDIEECMRRELIEELGVAPTVGRLLYVQNFIDDEDVHSVEFFFEITNGEDYVECDKLARTHSHELAEICWVSPHDSPRILPEQFARDFRAGNVLSDRTRVFRA